MLRRAHPPPLRVSVSNSSGPDLDGGRGSDEGAAGRKSKAGGGRRVWMKKINGIEGGR